jgi:putative cobalt transporter subunit CbtA
MPLTIEMPSAIRFLVPGALAGIVAFAFSRLMIEPLIGAAVDYEGAREHVESQLAGGEHEHGHELFTRTVQENVPGRRRAPRRVDRSLHGAETTR